MAKAFCWKSALHRQIDGASACGDNTCAKHEHRKVSSVSSFARESAGNNKLARIPMTEMTTSSSISVNAARVRPLKFVFVGDDVRRLGILSISVWLFIFSQSLVTSAATIKLGPSLG
jgi:hypothetical protein